MSGGMSATNGNIHDPLCDANGFGPPAKCDDCELIAKVRADEREQAAQRIEDIAPERTDRTNMVVLAFAMACDAARGES